MKKRIESDEIDLIEVIINIWNNKLKIAAITAIFIIYQQLYTLNLNLL
jgi:LPS O-antigen subunit length determinant protein (WzzB/FepE family)